MKQLKTMVWAAAVCVAALGNARAASITYDAFGNVAAFAPKAIIDDPARPAPASAARPSHSPRESSQPSPCRPAPWPACWRR